jgi:ectoine hydroxylase-related dioxygenase (phytanoyl-CoA dioxygenase family)
VTDVERGAALLLPDAAAIDVGAALATYREHGYARLGRVVTDDGLELLRARADDVMMGRVVHEGLFFQKDTESGSYDDLTFGRGYEGPSLDYRKVEKLERDPLFLAWIENALFERVARAHVGGEVAIYRAVLFNKPASGGTRLPWHQDAGVFWGLDRDPSLQIWTALDDAPREAGCVELVPGTHGARATHLGGMVPVDVAAKADAEARAIALPARAGEAILVHNYLWHRSGLNTTGRARRAFTVCYMSAETRCTRKRRAPRSFVRVFAAR